MVNREILLSVAGMNGIEDVESVIPEWMRGNAKAKNGMTKLGAQAILMALELKVMKGGAVGQLGVPMDEIQKLAA